MVCGGLPRTPQPSDGVSYAHKIEKAEAAIDWSQPAGTIERRIRAFDPFPGASTTLDGEALKVWRAVPAAGTGAPGEVLQAGDEGLRVACGDGALLLTELQRPGGRRLPARAVLQGLPPPVGRRLGA